MATSSEQTTRSFSSTLISLSRELFQAAQQAPAIDPSFEFPYEAASLALQKFLKTEKPISLRLKTEPTWAESEECQKLISDSSLLYEFSLSGISQPLYIAFPYSFYTHLFTQTFGLSAEILSHGESSDTFINRFRAFTLAQGIQALQSLPELKPFAITLSRIIPKEEKSTLFQKEPAIVATSEISIEGNGPRLQILSFATASFLKGFNDFRAPSFEERKNAICESVSVPITIELGRSCISTQELKKLRPGDLFLIEHPFYTPGSEKARVILTYNGKPIFRGKIKDNSLKILEMPFIPEVFAYVGSTLKQQHEPLTSVYQEHIVANQLSDNTSSITETLLEKDMQAHGDELMINNEITSEHEEEFDIENNPFEGEDSFEDEELESNQSDGVNAQGNQTTTDPSLHASHLIPEKIDINSIPQTVVIQLAQVTMTLDQLSKLTPGNVIDLNINPEHPVSLIIHDRVIGLGELVLVGDHVGVRIKDIGFSS